MSESTLDGGLCVIQRHNGAAFETIGEIIDNSGPGITRAAQDRTTKDDVVVGWKSFKPSKLKDGGECSMNIAYTPANSTHQNLLSDFSDELTHQYKVIFNDGAQVHEWPFNAFLTAFNPTAPLEEKLTAAITLKVSGAVTYIVS